MDPPSTLYLRLAAWNWSPARTSARGCCRARFLTNEARWFPAGSLAELPDIEANRGAYDIRRFELAPFGDAIFFDFLTVHGAPGFPFDSRRRVLSLRYLSADARHAPRRWRTSPVFDGLDAELAEGARALDHPLFPVVWPT